MAKPLQAGRQFRCRCGGVEFSTQGDPILTAVCYCDDCQAGGRQIEALAGATPALQPDGGTGVVLYRKDRVTCSKGATKLQNLKLSAKTATNRTVATCCNTGMSMTFDDSRHWIPMFRNQIAGPAPALEMRVCTKRRPAGVAFADSVPNYPGYPPALMWKLVKAWIPMLIGR